MAIMRNKRKVLSFIGRHTFTSSPPSLESITIFGSATCVSAKRRKAYYRIVAERERQTVSPSSTCARPTSHVAIKICCRRIDPWRLPLCIIQFTWVAIHNCNNNKPYTKWRWYRRARALFPKHECWNKRKWHQIKSHRYKCEECILVATQLLLLFGKVKRHHICRLV